MALNISSEAGRKEEKDWNNRDFITVCKINSNIKLSCGVPAKIMLDFFHTKVRYNKYDVVYSENAELLTLYQVLSRLGLSTDRASKLTFDELSEYLSNNKLLRKIFLGTDNYMGGRYFAEFDPENVQAQQKRDGNLH